MNKDPAFLFYSSDFFLSTLTMSFEDKGKFITLLCYMHQKGRLRSEDIKKLVGNLSNDLKGKFRIDENNLWYSERLEEETVKRNRYSTRSIENGKLGGRPPKTEAIETAINDDDSFDKFWGIYDKPTEKQNCKLKWGKLKKSDKELIFEKLPAYVEATPDRQFRKNPLTYLTRKAWLDEHLPQIHKTQKKSAFELLVETGKYE